MVEHQYFFLLLNSKSDHLWEYLTVQAQRKQNYSGQAIP